VKLIDVVCVGSIDEIERFHEISTPPGRGGSDENQRIAPIAGRKRGTRF